MRRSILLLVLSSACVSEQRLVVHVGKPGGAPLDGVVLACVCEPEGNAGAVTDTAGSAELVIFNSDPETCVITAARGGYLTQQVAVEEPDGELTIELEPVP
jgi:hypothetical protein